MQPLAHPAARAIHATPYPKIYTILFMMSNCSVEKERERERVPFPRKYLLFAYAVFGAFLPIWTRRKLPSPQPRRRHLSLIFSAQKPKRNDEFVVAILPPSLSCQDGARHAPSKMMQTGSADFALVI